PQPAGHLLIEGKHCTNPLLLRKEVRNLERVATVGRIGHETIGIGARHPAHRNGITDAINQNVAGVAGRRAIVRPAHLSQVRAEKITILSVQTITELTLRRDGKLASLPHLTSEETVLMLLVMIAPSITGVHFQAVKTTT